MNVPCTCPSPACYVHGNTVAVHLAARMVRAGHAEAALRVLDRAARRPWWAGHLETAS